MFLLCSLNSTGWLRHLLFLKEFVFRDHFQLCIPRLFFFFNVKKTIQHSFHSKPKKNLFCTYIHSHVYFLRGWELNETQEQLFVLWYSEANLEAALNTQLTRPYLPCGIKSKLPSLLGRGGLNSAKTCAQPTSAKWSFPELVFRGRRCCVGCR